MKRVMVAALISGSTLPSHAGSAYDLMSGHPEAKQLAAFASVIDSAGSRCGTASRLFYLGDDSRSAAGYWTVRCANEDFIVSVANDPVGGTQVLSCKVANIVGATCWKPF